MTTKQSVPTQALPGLPRQTAAPFPDATAGGGQPPLASDAGYDGSSGRSATISARVCPGATISTFPRYPSRVGLPQQRNAAVRQPRPAVGRQAMPPSPCPSGLRPPALLGRPPPSRNPTFRRARPGGLFARLAAPARPSAADAGARRFVAKVVGPRRCLSVTVRPVREGNEESWRSRGVLPRTSAVRQGPQTTQLVRVWVPRCGRNTAPGSAPYTR